jgi:hypothetical protein
MTIPGVGAITSLAFRVTVDDPARFDSSKAIGAHIGLTPRVYQRHPSGQELPPQCRHRAVIARPGTARHRTKGDGQTAGPGRPKGQGLLAADDHSRRWSHYQPCFQGNGDDPARFDSSKAIGAHIGLTPRVYQSGEIDRSGHISKAGDHMLRHLLYEAASALMTRCRQPSKLRAWAWL